MQDPPKKVLGERAAHGGNQVNPSPKDHGHLVNLQRGEGCKEQHQVRGREGGLKSKDYQDRQSRGRPYWRDHVPSSNLDRADHFGPFHGSNRRRKRKRMITLDLNHFGFQRAGRQRGERRVEEIVKEEKKVPIQGQPQWG